MIEQTFTKLLTANDSGESGGHQAGIHIPKGEKDLIAFLPQLDLGVKNPDAWINCTDENGREWAFRYICYNNKLHDLGGTRYEYRITHMTKYFRVAGARAGDEFRISGETNQPEYQISVVPADAQDQTLQTGRIKLTGWRRVH